MDKLKTRFECGICNFRAANYLDGWRGHLLEEEHQDRARELTKTFTDADKERCCVVFGVSSFSRIDVFDFFSEKNVIANTVFWNDSMNICLVEFFLKGSAADVAAPGRTTSILGKNVLVRLRSQIPDAEWLSICPSGGSPVKVETEEVNPELVDEAEYNDCASDVLYRLWLNQKETVFPSTSTEPIGRSAIVPSVSSNHSFSNVTKSGVKTIRSNSQEDVEEVPPRKKLRVNPNIPNQEAASSHTEDQNNFSMTLGIFNGFKNKARLLINSGPMTNGFRSCNLTDVHVFWLQLLQEFNLLVWENLFGIELFAVTSSSEPNPNLRMNTTHTKQVGPLIKGILTTHDRRVKKLIMQKENRKQLKKQRRILSAKFMKSLKNGSLMSRPLKPFDEAARRLCQFGIHAPPPLSFNLQMVGFNETVSNSKPRLGCRVNFTNVVVRSNNLVQCGSLEQMRNVGEMFQMLWQKFSAWRVES